ncbi:hypothetical protein lerEdw1_015824 [Lerista edwardsae]|nr:hypothetical protein lerEdw1_015824 [Lerista edwardsae]
MAGPNREPEKRACVEDVWVRLNPSPPANFRQAVVLEVQRCHSNPTGTGGGTEGEGTSSRGRPLPEGGPLLGDQAASSGHAEENLSPGWGNGEAGKPRGSPHKDSAAACGPGQAWLPPAAGEQVAASLAPSSADQETCAAGAGEELPWLETVVAMEQGSLGLPAGGGQEGAGRPCRVPAEDTVSGGEQECPICTELYDHDQRRPALLNCGHVLCGRCLRAIMEAATTADFGRVRCPICRQKTPMLEWEICKLQEELQLLDSGPAPASPPPPALPLLPARRPGFWGGLEHHFEVRFCTSRMVGFLPCLRYPPCMISGLARLKRRCRWGYRLALSALVVAETLSVLLVFLPIALLLLLFLILER